MSTRLARSTACSKRWFATTSRLASPSLHATNPASIIPMRSSPPITDLLSCRHGSKSRVTRQRRRWRYKSFRDSCWRDCATGASSRSTNSTLQSGNVSPISMPRLCARLARAGASCSRRSSVQRSSHCRPNPIAMPSGDGLASHPTTISRSPATTTRCRRGSSARWSRRGSRPLRSRFSIAASASPATPSRPCGTGHHDC